MDIINTTYADSKTTENPPDPEMEFVETHYLITKVVYVLIACASLLITSLAIVIMRQTKKIPYTTKVLSSGLMVYDSVFILTSTVRKFITDSVINLTLQSIIGIVLLLSAVTVGMMAIERCVLINKPMFYIGKLSKTRVKFLIIASWVSVALLSIYIKYGACYSLFQTVDVFTKPRTCIMMFSLYFIAWDALVLLVSIISYCKIYAYLRTIRVIGKTMKSRRHPGVQMKNLKSTSLVFAYILVIMLTSAAYITIIVVANFTAINYSLSRLIADILFLCSCLLHPFLYVLWFKESRLVMLRILSRYFTALKPKVYTMTIEVYDIVIK